VVRSCKGFWDGFVANYLTGPGAPETISRGQRGECSAGTTTSRPTVADAGPFDLFRQVDRR